MGITLDEVLKHPWISRAESVASPKSYTQSFANKLKEFNQKRKDGLVDSVKLVINMKRLAQAVKNKRAASTESAAAAAAGGGKERAADAEEDFDLQYCPTDHILPDPAMES